MKYYFYMYIAISLILLSISVFKVGFSITLLFLLLFIALTAMTCINNIKTLSIKKHYIPIIIFAVLYNVYISFDKLTDISNILIFAFNLGLSFIVPWLIFTLINRICNYKNITNIFGIAPIIPASFICVIGLNSTFKFIIWLAVTGFIYVFPYILYYSYKNDIKKFRSYILVLIGLILLIITYFVDCKTALYFLVFGIYLTIQGLRLIIKNQNHTNITIEQLNPVVPIFYFATICVMLNLNI